MLYQLRLRNYLLIPFGEVHFDPHLNIITGETGAGKSIFVEAIQYLLGKRISRFVFPPEGEKTIIEGQFSIAELPNLTQKLLELGYIEESESEIWLYREITSNQKSRTFLNDTPIHLQLVQELFAPYVDIHSQHETQLLLKPAYQLEILDTYAEIEDLLQQFQNLYQTYQEKELFLQRKRHEIEQLKREKEFLTYQFQELSSIPLETLNEEELVEEWKLLQNVQEIKEKLAELYHELYESDYAIIGRLASGKHLLQSLQDKFSSIQPLLTSWEETLAQLEEISRELHHHLFSLEEDPERLHGLTQLMNRLNELKLKYRSSSVQELIDFKKEVEEKLKEIQFSDQLIKQALGELKELRSQLTEIGYEMEKKRKEAAKLLEEKVLERLKQVKLEKAQFQILIERVEEDSSPFQLEGKKYKLFPKGFNRVTFLLQMNPGLGFAPLSEVASGGEQARVMLALKAALAEKLQSRLLIFDEIDAGISGETALRVGTLLESLAQHRQVILITHTPQVASRHGKHFSVRKIQKEDVTYTHIQPLSADERIEEIARMLSGTISEASLQNAKALLSSQKV